MNDGSGRFKVDNSRLPQSLARQITFASRFLDANGDGFPDLFLSLGFSDTDYLLLNDGKGRFQDMVPGALPPKIGGSNSATRRAVVGDLNRDGFPDLVLSSQASKHSGFQVLISRGDGTFDDRTMDWLPDTVLQRSTLRATEVLISGEMLLKDLNGDGFLDLLIEWGPNSRLYMNNGQRFVDASSFLPFMAGGQFAVEDFDGDGRPDIVYGEIDEAGKALLLVGLNKGQYAPPPPAAPLDPAAPAIGPMSIHNDGSGSVETLAPGARIRIIGNYLGPADPVTVTEAPGVALPTTLADVTVTFDSTPARLISVSKTQLVAVVPFSVSGRWVSTVQVAYQGRVSQPVNMFISESNPMVYARPIPGKFVVPYFVAEAWKVNGAERLKVTKAGQIKWGDRIAFRLTGAGQAQKALADDNATYVQEFTPANQVPAFLGMPGVGKPLALTPVSMTYAPGGLAGVVEVVVDLPQAEPKDYWWQFFVPDLMNPAAGRTLLWPLDGLPPAITCSCLPSPPVFASVAGGATPPAKACSVVTTPPGLSVTSQVTTASGGGWLSANLSSGVSPAAISLSVNPSGLAVGSYAGTVTVSASNGDSFAVPVTLNVLAAPVIGAGGVVIHASSAAVASPGSLFDIYGTGLATAPLVAPPGGQLPTLLGNTQVLVNGAAAPLLYVGPDQIVAQIPSSTAYGNASVVVSHLGAKSGAQSIRIQQAAPSLLTFGGNRAIVQNQDYSLNTAANPAQTGSYAIVYLMGSGPVNPVPLDGTPAAVSPLSYETLPTVVNVGGA